MAKNDRELFIGSASESLSPVESFIRLHEIDVTQPEIIRKRWGEVKTPWIAEYDGLLAVGSTRNEAVLKVAKSFALAGWDKISW